jgi:hypothetical protein
MKGSFAEWAARALVYVCVFLLGATAVGALGTFLKLGRSEETFFGGEAGVYEIRSRLLMEATDHVGSCTPEDAARVWAEGLKQRSAAMQYAVMTNALKDKYARQLDTTFPSWATGVSSPWIEQYNLLDAKQTADDAYRFVIRFKTVTSSGPAGSYDAALSVVKEDGFWRISDVEADEALDAYTGFE